MAMKIGGEYLLDNVFPRHFEKLANETGLAKPLVRRRVPELAAMVIDALKTRHTDTDTDTDTDTSAGENIAQIIRERCDKTISIFHG
jgi:hypothetical protein